MANVEKRHSHACTVPVNHIRQPDNRIRQIVSYKSAFMQIRFYWDLLETRFLHSGKLRGYKTFITTIRTICNEL